MKIPLVIKFLLCGSVVTLLCGFTHIWNVSFPPAHYPQGVKSKLKVQLVLSNELKSATWEGPIAPGEKARIPVGEELAKNVESLARALFSDVTISDTKSVPKSNTVDAFLVPQLVAFARSQPTTIVGQQTTTISLEWRLISPEDKVLWVDTVSGSATTSLGSNPMRSATNQVERATALLLAKSYSSIVLSAPFSESKVEVPANAQKIEDLLRVRKPEIFILCEELKSSNVDVVVHTLKVLRGMDAPEAVPAILPLLKHEKRGVVRDACRTLAVLGGKVNVPSIEPLLNHDDSKVRKDAADAIAALNKK